MVKEGATVLVRVVPQAYMRDDRSRTGITVAEVVPPKNVRLEFEVLETWPGFVNGGTEIDGTVDVHFDLFDDDSAYLRTSWDWEWLDRWTETGIGTYRLEVVGAESAPNAPDAENTRMTRNLNDNDTRAFGLDDILRLVDSTQEARNTVQADNPLEPVIDALVRLAAVIPLGRMVIKRARFVPNSRPGQPDRVQYGARAVVIHNGEWESWPQDYGSSHRDRDEVWLNCSTRNFELYRRVDVDSVWADSWSNDTRTFVRVVRPDEVLADTDLLQGCADAIVRLVGKAEATRLHLTRQKRSASVVRDALSAANGLPEALAQAVERLDND